MQHLNATLRDRIMLRQFPARRLPVALSIHNDIMAGFHARSGRGDDPVCRLDDVAGRAVVLDQEFRLRPIVVLELADEIDRGTGEGIDVLIVVADREQAEPQVGIVQRTPGNGSDQRIFLGADILIFVDQNQR